MTPTCTVCVLHAESTFKVEGMDCREEVAMLERRFKNLKGLEEFMARHLRYADLEAQEILKARARANTSQRQGRLLGSWPDRRRFLKLNVWYRIPARPAVRFFWMFVAKRGFLDGREGRVYCELIASYEALIDAKLLELEREGRAERPV